MIIEHCTMPIIITNDYQRFDQKLTIFARGKWDPEVIPVRKKYEEKHYSLTPPSGSEGYTKLERALRTAAWSVCFEYASENEYGCANQGFYDWVGEKNPQQVTFPDLKEASLIVKNAAKFLGASLVGIAEYEPKWIYSSLYNFSTKESVPSQFPFQIKNVIVLALEIDYDACLTSPSLISCAATGLGYSHMAEVGKKLATFIRMLGYNAIPSGNDIALSIPIAVQAGLGEVGRNGMLITPEYGPRVRLLKIFTDLPLQTDKPITFGVSQFCMKCRKCSQSCPASAIPMETKPTMTGSSISNCHGVLKWYTNPESCFNFWALNGGECNNCIACCPYNKWSSWHHGLTRSLTESMEERPLFAMGFKTNGKNQMKLKIPPSMIKLGPSSMELEQPSGEAGFAIINYALYKASWVINDEGLYKWNAEPNIYKMEFKDTEEASAIVKKAAKFLGANLVGIADYDKKWMYSDDCQFQPKSVIVMAIEMDNAACQTESSLITAAATGLGYSHMAEVAKKVATFISQLGYRAIPCGDDTALSIPLAILAGLGEYGRNGLLITEEFGSRVRICKVLTELPLMADKPIAFDLKDFCIACTICAEVCPAQAIPNISDCSQIDKWVIDTEKCFQYGALHSTDCCKCITACPYNKSAGWDHDFTRIMANIPLSSILNKENSTSGSKKVINENALKNWWKKG